MDIKELLKKLEKNLRDLDRDDNKLTGNYILVVERQKSVQTIMDCNINIIKHSVIHLFETLSRTDKIKSLKLIAVLLKYLFKIKTPIERQLK